MNFNSLPPQAYSNHGYNLSENATTKDKSTATPVAADQITTSDTKTTEKTESNDDNQTPTEKKSDISAQEKIVGNIKILQNKMSEVRADTSLTKEQSAEQLAELKTQLDEQLQNVQLIIRKQTSTLVQSLFASNGASNAGMFFNNKA